MKVGKHIIPERITHAPWFEIFKLGILAKKNRGNYGKMANDTAKVFFGNAPGSEFTKALFKAVEGDLTDTNKATLGNVVPQDPLEIVNDYILNQKHKTSLSTTHRKGHPLI